MSYLEKYHLQKVEPVKNRIKQNKTNIEKSLILGNFFVGKIPLFCAFLSIWKTETNAHH